MAEEMEPLSFEEQLKKKVLEIYAIEEQRVLAEMKNFEQQMCQEINDLKEKMKGAVTEIHTYIDEHKSTEDFFVYKNLSFIKMINLEREVFEERLKKLKARVAFSEQEQLKLHLEKLNAEIKWINKLVEVETLHQYELDELLKILEGSKDESEVEKLSQLQTQQLWDKIALEDWKASVIRREILVEEINKNIKELKSQQNDKLMMNEIQQCLKTEKINAEEKLKQFQWIVGGTEVEEKIQEEYLKNEEFIMKDEGLPEELVKLNIDLCGTKAKELKLQRDFVQIEKKKNSLKEAKIRQDILDKLGRLLKTELECSVCKELFVMPVALKCMHTFCENCITKKKNKNKNCPICGISYQSGNRCIEWNNFINKISANLSKDIQKRRLKILEQRKGRKGH